MLFLQVTTDCARYNSDQVVKIVVKGPEMPGAHLRLRWFNCGHELPKEATTGTWNGLATFAWTPPREDGKGYQAIAEVVAKDGHVAYRGSCGVDISSSWLRYPRYGYLSHFEPALADRAGEIVEALKDFHLNALQFYDWQWKHHRPLSPNREWTDIANRTNSAVTIKAFIAEAHKRNIACMAYNLGYGAVDGHLNDGTKLEWALFDDNKAKQQYGLTMPSGWATKRLDLFDPANPGWIDFITGRQKVAQAEFGFDGWHMDQLGNPGQKFTRDGTPIELSSRFRVLLDQAKTKVPGALIFNNVGGYGIAETLGSRTDAMYAEMWEWEGQKTYSDVQKVIERSRSTGKASIVTAYMDYDMAKKFDGQASPGEFNPHGVLLTNATILASGGTHLELGDGRYMLDHEYFPNRNLQPSRSLLERLRSYYDFSVTYQELLCGPQVSPAPNRVKLEKLPASSDSEPGKVWTFSRTVGNRTVVHFINLLSAKDVEWRDRHGIRTEPSVMENIRIQLPQGFAGRVWVASPDDGIGAAIPLEVNGGSVVIPSLEYWTMLTLEP